MARENAGGTVLARHRTSPRGGPMELLWNDLRFALRTLRPNPGFTAVVLVTLALGIGANSAIYGLMDQVLLRPLPVQRPGQLVLLDAPGIFNGRSSTQYSSFTPMSRSEEHTSELQSLRHRVC